jgi:hypothetical protein
LRLLHAASTSQRTTHFFHTQHTTRRELLVHRHVWVLTDLLFLRNNPI